MRIEKWLHNKCEENRSPILNSLFIYPAFLNSQSPIYQVFENSIARYLEKHGHPYIQLKAVLFDMDGVLFNSMPYHADAWHKVMERHGLHLSREEAYMHEGRTGASTINIVYQRQYGKDATPEMIESIYAEKSAEFSTHPEPERMPGAWEVLQKVKAAGLIPVLVTKDSSSSNSYYGTSANVISIQHDLKPGYVRLKGGSKKGADGKPDPNNVLKLEVVSTNFGTKSK